MEAETSFADAVDALKAITAYLTMDNKIAGKSQDDSGTSSFDDFRADLNNVEQLNGRPKVRSGAGRPASGGHGG